MRGRCGWRLERHAAFCGPASVEKTTSDQVLEDEPQAHSERPIVIAVVVSTNTVLNRASE
jgi:hypothetical protein